MLYLLIRPFARLFLSIFFRKVYLHGSEKIPAHGPVILASNHPNAFSEACLYACFQPRPVYFLTRADVFKIPLVNRILRSLNLIPIYRFRDGYSSLKNNEISFRECYKILAKGGMVIIFSEASCVSEKRLRPIQRGTARLAFGAVEDQNLSNVTILPIVINYAKLAGFRGEIMINVGDPIHSKDFVAEYSNNKPQTIRTVTEILENRLKPMMVHFDNKQVERKAEYLLDRAVEEFNSPFWPPYKKDNTLFLKCKEIADRANLYPEEVLNQILPTNYEYNPYDSRVIHSAFGKNRMVIALFLLLGFPIFLVGMVLNGIPYYLANYAATYKVKTTEFYLSVKMAVQMLVQILLGFIALLFGLIFGKFWIALKLGFVAIATGYFAVFYREQWTAFKASAFKEI